MLTENAKMLRKLDDLKKEPVIECNLIGFKFADIIKICKAWSACNVKIEASSCENDGIWDCVSMDLEKFKIGCGLVEPGVFERCLHSGLLYPDGTFNSDYIYEKMNMIITEKHKH